MVAPRKQHLAPNIATKRTNKSGGEGREDQCTESKEENKQLNYSHNSRTALAEKRGGTQAKSMAMDN